jgi:hypothetical protein
MMNFRIEGQNIYFEFREFLTDKLIHEESFDLETCEEIAEDLERCIAQIKRGIN